MPGFKMKDKKKLKMGTQLYGYGGEVKKKKKIMYKDGREVPELTSAQMKLPAALKDQIIRSKKKDMDKKKG
tara:strand:- start:2081 stop:2293 length:213 start_codon:yes stop_codon:yes gene_type:complete